MCAALVDCFEQISLKFFGPICTTDILIVMRQYIGECTDKDSYDFWYEKWIGVIHAILEALKTDTVINYGFRCDALFRVLSAAASDVNIFPYLPPFNITLIVSIPSKTFKFSLFNSLKIMRKHIVHIFINKFI